MPLLTRELARCVSSSPSIRAVALAATISGDRRRTVRNDPHAPPTDSGNNSRVGIATGRLTFVASDRATGIRLIACQPRTRFAATAPVSKGALQLNLCVRPRHASLQRNDPLTAYWYRRALDVHTRATRLLSGHPRGAIRPTLHREARLWTRRSAGWRGAPRYRAAWRSRRPHGDESDHRGRGGVQRVHGRPMTAP